MSFKWLHTEPTCFAGGAFNAHVSSHPESGMQWKEEDLVFILRGYISLNGLAANGKPAEDIVFYEDIRYPYEERPWVKFDGFLEPGRRSCCGFQLPEDPSFKHIYADVKDPIISAGLPKARPLPDSGMLDPRATICYAVTAEIVDRVSGRVTQSTIQVSFYNVREDLDPPTNAYHESQGKTTDGAIAEDAAECIEVHSRFATVFAPGRPFTFHLKVASGKVDQSTVRTLRSVAVTLREHAILEPSKRSEVLDLREHEILMKRDICFSISEHEDLNGWIDVSSLLDNPNFSVDCHSSVQIPEFERHFELKAELEITIGVDVRHYLFTCGRVTVLPAATASLVRAHIENESWCRQEGPYPNAVNRERRRLGI